MNESQQQHEMLMLRYTERSLKQLTQTQTTLQIIQDFLFFGLVLMVFIFVYLSFGFRVGALIGFITGVTLWSHVKKQKDLQSPLLD